MLGVEFSTFQIPPVSPVSRALVAGVVELLKVDVVARIWILKLVDLLVLDLPVHRVASLGGETEQSVAFIANPASAVAPAPIAVLDAGLRRPVRA